MLDTFYRTLLPATGYYTLFIGARKQHKWAASLDDLLQMTGAAIDAHTPDLYFATASFVEDNSRSQANVSARKCFAFDIDAGPEKFAKHGEKVYETRDAALAAVVAWCTQHKFKPTYIVASGAGLHVYFALDADTAPADWLPVAKSLKTRALADGLRIDPAVTADSARVLRPLGALHKSGALVESLAATGKTYTLAQVAAKFPPEVRRVRRKLNDEVLAVQTLPRSVWRIIPECAAMRAVFDAKGEVDEPYWRAALGVVKHTIEGRDAAHEMSRGHPDYDPAQTDEKFDRWTMGPSTCATLADHNQAACAGCPHKGKITSPIVLGNPKPEDVPPTQHPAVAPVIEQSAAEDLMSGDDAPVSTWVPPWTGYIPTEAGFAVAVTPTGYVMTQKMRVPVVDPDTGEKSEVEKVQPFCSSVFWFESWFPGSKDDEAGTAFAMYDPRKREVVRHTMPTRHLAKRDSLLAALAAQNIQVFPQREHCKRAMVDLVSSALERIRLNGARAKIRDRFGTSFEGTDLTVAQGQYVIRKGGGIMLGHADPDVESAGSVFTLPLPQSDTGTWSEDVWDTHVAPLAREHVEYLNRWFSGEGRKGQQVAILAALASPLLAFVEGYAPGAPLPRVGLTVSLYSSQPGRGKTQGLKAAALAFGFVSALAKGRDSTGATANARAKRLAMNGTMPGFFDEAGATDATEMNNLIRNIANGTLDKERMTVGLKVIGGVPSSLITVITTNKSARDICAAVQSESAAVQVRMLEVDCSNLAAPTDEEDAAHKQAWNAIENRCAGALGGLIHRTIVNAGPELLNALGAKCYAKARAIAGANGVSDTTLTEGRFQVKGMAAILMLQRILKVLDLRLFNDDEVTAEFKKLFDACYDFVGDAVLTDDPVERLGIAITDLMPRIVVTDTFPLYGRDCGMPLNARIPDEVAGRLDLFHRVVYLRVDALQQWARDRRVSFEAMVAGCRKAGVFQRIFPSHPNLSREVDLMRGIRGTPGVTNRAYKIDLVKLKIDTDKYDDASEKQPERPKVVPIKK